MLQPSQVLINPKNLCYLGVIQQVLINSNKLLDLIYRLPMECEPPGEDEKAVLQRLVFSLNNQMENGAQKLALEDF